MVTDMTTTNTTLFTNETTGQLCCADHVGHYAQTAIAARPNAKRWDTPLGDWTRWTADDDAAWVAAIGSAATCEVCGR